MLSSLPVNNKVHAQDREAGRGRRIRRAREEGGRKDRADEIEHSLLTKGPPALRIPSSPAQAESQPSWTSLSSLLSCLLLLPGGCCPLARGRDCQLL